MINPAKPILLSLTALAMLSGCSTMMNPAGSGEYGCEGSTEGVVCKTPLAIYKSTHLDSPVTIHDTPIVGSVANDSAQSPQPGAIISAKIADAASIPQAAIAGPRPVREPAQVVRIWIAPWVDKQDNLHLAQTQYAEVKPRTWTVGKPEVSAGAGYVIPHRAFDAISAPAARPNPADVKSDIRSMDSPPAGNSPSTREVEANSMVAPTN